ncbi:MAG TPA: phage baseplate assembly protein V [Sphingobium sp.]|nr:phage baseplate assembly protein V [Sphingobium sp.]
MSAKPDIQRLVGDIVRAGLIASVDHAARRCTVEIGDLETGPLPWLAFRAGRLRIWSPPSVGEQCVLICPEGDTNAGIVLLGLYCDAFDAPDSSPDIIKLEFEDGTAISYDMAAHTLTISLASGGTATIDAPGGITINGPVTINDDVTLNGKLTASDDVIADGKSLKGHMHSGVQPGSGQSGAPV